MSAIEDVQRAVSLHQAGRLEEARALYSSVLAEDHEQPDALHFLGLLSYQMGQPRLGLELIQRAIEHSPYYADAHSNLGNILKELGHYQEARTSYENALACAPRNAEAHNNLSVLLRHMGDGQRALEHAMAAVGIQPDSAWAHYNLGTAYAALRHPGLAAESFRRAVSLDESLTDGYRMLGFTLYGMKKFDDARRVYSRLLELDPSNEVAHHLLAASSKGASPERASAGFVRQTFEQFAASFDGQLERLSYRGPQLVEQILGEQRPERTESLRVLDMGCGTGLCGPILRPWARRLVGVDLSPEMLSRAHGRDCYDELVEGDLVDFLSSTDERFDLIVAADTLIYFGELGPVIRGAAARLAAGGLLVFTLERATEAGRQGYRLEPSGRYTHTRNHAESRLVGAGLEIIAIESEGVREEFGEPVAGWAVTAQKP